MLELIFRCRARMAIVYGRVDPRPIAGERFVAAALGRPPARAPERPGELGFRGRALEIRPMPARVDRRRAS